MDKCPLDISALDGRALSTQNIIWKCVWILFHPKYSPVWFTSMTKKGRASQSGKEEKDSSVRGEAAINYLIIEFTYWSPLYHASFLFPCCKLVTMKPEYSCSL